MDEEDGFEDPGTNDAEALVQLAESLQFLLDQFIEEHPDTAIDRIEAVVGYIHGAMFRLASELPASKLH